MEPDLDRLFGALTDANQLKRIPRTGWLLRGVGSASAESVAEHTCGVALTALFLSQWVEAPLDLARVLTICLLHDLAEIKILDLTPSSLRYLTPEVKRRAEQAAMAALLSDLPAGQDWFALWQEYDEASSAEARLVRDADRLEMLMQAFAYEQAGWRNLDEFWEQSENHAWEFSACAALFEDLLARRSYTMAKVAGRSAQEPAPATLRPNPYTGGCAHPKGE